MWGLPAPAVEVWDEGGEEEEAPKDVLLPEEEEEQAKKKREGRVSCPAYDWFAVSFPCCGGPRPITPRPPVPGAPLVPRGEGGSTRACASGPQLHRTLALFAGRMTAGKSTTNTGDLPRDFQLMFFNRFCCKNLKSSGGRAGLGTEVT